MSTTPLRAHGGDHPISEEIRPHVEQTENSATISFDQWGSCVLRTEPDALTVDIHADDERAVERIRDIVTRDLGRFGRGDLVVTWREFDDTGTL